MIMLDSIGKDISLTLSVFLCVLLTACVSYSKNLTVLHLQLSKTCKKKVS